MTLFVKPGGRGKSRRQELFEKEGKKKLPGNLCESA
jgi:hypothetical protein